MQTARPQGVTKKKKKRVFNNNKPHVQTTSEK